MPEMFNRGILQKEKAPELQGGMNDINELLCEKNVDEFLSKLEKIENKIDYAKKIKILEATQKLVKSSILDENVLIQLVFKVGRIISKNEFTNVSFEDFRAYICTYDDINYDEFLGDEDSHISISYQKIDSSERDRVCAEYYDSTNHRGATFISREIIAAIRSMKTCSRWKEITWEPFIPEEEIEKILFFSDEEKQLNKEQKRKLRQNRLKKCEEKIYAQKIGIGKIVSDLDFELRRDPSMDREKIKDIVYEAAKKYELSPYQLELFEEKIAIYEYRHNTINELRESYPNDTDLFFSIFGFYPKGKIKIITLPMTFSIVCYDKVDYSRLWSRKDDVNDEDIRKSSQSGGFFTENKKMGYMEGLLIFNNASNYDYHSTNTDIHEEQHAIHAFFMKNDYLTKKYFLESAKGEILAYFKDNTDLKYILQILINSTLYENSFHEFKNKWIQQKRGDSGQAKNQNLQEAIIKDSYTKLIKDSLSVLEILLANGFLKNDIIYLLIDKPLLSWPKIITRLFPKKPSLDLDDAIRKLITERWEDWENMEDDLDRDFLKKDERRKKKISQEK